MKKEELQDLEQLRHTCAHLLAAAVLKLFPDAKPTIGPAIEHGFYYDFDFSTPFSSDDLVRIEQTMKELISTWDGVTSREVSLQQAQEIYALNPYKLELIKEIADRGEPITLYTWGDFEDLCRGGHIKSAKKIKVSGFCLTHLAGAYWRGSEKNPMLTRIYGLAFEKKTDLDNHLVMLEEAKKRDHRKIGHDQELFFIDEVVGKGLVLWLPNGTLIRNEIEQLAEKMESRNGYVRVSTPHLAKEELFLTSGHLPYYKDSMYPGMVMDDGTYYLRAMNCPHHHTVYKYKPHSYRELPLRIAEYGTVYRNELSGTLAGLLRVRGLTMNDAHIYCRKDQIKDEFRSVLSMIIEYFTIFNLTNYWFRLSKWGPDHLEKYINEPENWNYAESVLREVLVEMNVEFVEVDDEAAFYGPKVDVQFKSVIGREETMSTVQLDFAAKSRFKLMYIDETGKENNEVFVIHRAPLSTHERFMAFLIEHTGGVWPTWLAPTQALILSVGQAHGDAVQNLRAMLQEAGIRASCDNSDETVGNKIRKGEIGKVPYMLVVGDKEMDLQTVAVRKRGSREIKTMDTAEFIEQIQKEVDNKLAS